jgi:uncharacterized RDD family membrane protein YckC
VYRNNIFSFYGVLVHKVFYNKLWPNPSTCPIKLDLLYWLLISSITALRKLSLNKTAKLVFFNDGGERTAQFSPATAGQRFVNRLVDAIIIIYILLINLLSLNNISGFGKIAPEILIIIEIPFLLFYYIILEGIFNTTAGKCATNTTIVNEVGERPGFSQILGRTFCRLIPFEAFSFLGANARGWHDSLSNTYVVDGVNREDLGMNEITLDAELENAKP